MRVGVGQEMVRRGYVEHVEILKGNGKGIVFSPSIVFKVGFSRLFIGHIIIRRHG